ncbi:MAG: hypothetical protein AB1679_08660 [Actinomycetota bacterium]|jgi:hypothetical protein
MYYDRAGTAICETCWKRYWADEEYRLLARSDVGEWTVAAWWAGVDDGATGEPRVFRTGLLSKPRQGGTASPLVQEWRHRSADEAVAHHDALVARLSGEDTAAPSPPAAAGHSCDCH